MLYAVVIVFLLLQSVGAAARPRAPLFNIQTGNPKIREFEFGPVLGSGWSGYVYQVTATYNGEHYALKRIAINEKFLRTKQIENSVRREIIVHRFLFHPNIVRLVASFADDDYVHIVTELCVGGSLKDKFGENGLVSESYAKSLLYQIAQGIIYLHTNHKVVHRDLKLENIFLDDKGNVKIGDFGLAQFVISDTALTDIVGTYMYMAPEMLKRTSYTYSVDIWAFGIIAFRMLFGKFPFAGITTLDELTERVTNASAVEFPTTVAISDDAMNIITQLLEVDPAKRPNIRQVMDHPWWKTLDTPEPDLETVDKSSGPKAITIW